MAHLDGKADPDLLHEGLHLWPEVGGGDRGCGKICERLSILPQMQFVSSTSYLWAFVNFVSNVICGLHILFVSVVNFTSDVICELYVLFVSNVNFSSNVICVLHILFVSVVNFSSDVICELYILFVSVINFTSDVICELYVLFVSVVNFSSNVICGIHTVERHQFFLDVICELCIHWIWQVPSCNLNYKLTQIYTLNCDCD